jgi:hypothetical protein
MPAVIAFDQTLVSALVAIAAAAVAYWRAAHVLRHAAARRDLEQRRDALEQVLAAIVEPVADYMRDDTLDYPQREMVELERRALQAQVLFWRDLAMQEALRNITYPKTHAAAAQHLRDAAAKLA